MRKVIILSLFLIFLLSACSKDDRTITFNIEDNYEIDILLGEDDIDLNFIEAIDEDGMNLSPFLEIVGEYDLNTVGTYNLTITVTDNFGTQGSVDIILNVIELSCEQDSTQDKCIISVTNISFTEESALVNELYVNDFIKLKWNITPSDALNKDVIITSSNPLIATVNIYGYVFGISEGSVDITIKTVDGNFTLIKTINIIEKSCALDPYQDKCINLFLSDTTRIITLQDENISGTDYTQVYLNNKIYYQIFVRSFADSDGDNIGDFQGIIDNLTYLKSLGVGGLWLMPMMQSRADHGYETDDYYDVDDEYGTMVDFKELVSAAELVGIDIIIDLVINHMGAHNDIFQDVLKNGTSSIYYDWFTWIDNTDSRYGTKGSWGQTIWWNPSSNPYIKKTTFSVHSSLNGKYFAGYFSEWMPDLNFTNTEVVNYIYDVGTWWLEETGIKGYRMDAIAHIYGYNEYLGISDTHQANIDLLTNFRNNCLLANSNVYIVGEVWDSYYTYSKYYEAGISTFNFAVGDYIISAVNGNLGTSYSSVLDQVYNEIEKYSTEYIDAPFLKNHDQDRIASILDNDDKLRMAAEALLFLPGNPYIYYGDEIGMLGTRTNFLWGTYYDSLYADYADRYVDTVSEQLALPDSLLNAYIAMGETRTNSLALMYGDYQAYSEGGLDGFFRIFENGEDKELVIVLFNFSSVYSKPIPPGFTSYEILYSSYENNFGGISPKGTIVLKIPYELKDTFIN